MLASQPARSWSPPVASGREPCGACLQGSLFVRLILSRSALPSPGAMLAGIPVRDADVVELVRLLRGAGFPDVAYKIDHGIELGTRVNALTIVDRESILQRSTSRPRALPSSVPCCFKSTSGGCGKVLSEGFGLQRLHPREIVRRVAAGRIPGCDIVQRRPHELSRHGMAAHAVLLLRQRKPLCRFRACRAGECQSACQQKCRIRLRFHYGLRR